VVNAPGTAARIASATALLIVLTAACGPVSPPGQIRLPATPLLLSPGPFQHAALASALAADADPADRPEASRRFRSYLATIAAVGPRTRPDLFPTAEDVFAYLVNAHVAWTIELDAAPELVGVRRLMRQWIPFTLDGERSSLVALEREIERRAALDARLGLWFDTGRTGRPPRPPVPLEGHAFGYLIDLQARRCGAEPGTWALDAAGRQLAVAGYAISLSGLPQGTTRRARRLFDVVPPPAGLRQRILDVCGNGLQHCRISTTDATALR
jgi:hypothetical protein